MKDKETHSGQQRIIFFPLLQFSKMLKNERMKHHGCDLHQHSWAGVGEGGRDVIYYALNKQDAPLIPCRMN